MVLGLLDYTFCVDFGILVSVGVLGYYKTEFCGTWYFGFCLGLDVYLGILLVW